MVCVFDNVPDAVDAQGSSCESGAEGKSMSVDKRIQCVSLSFRMIGEGAAQWRGTGMANKSYYENSSLR